MAKAGRFPFRTSRRTGGTRSKGLASRSQRRRETRRRLFYEPLESRYALAGDSLACVFFEFADPDAPSTPLSSLQVGEDYLMQVFVQDNRGADADGIFQAYFDMSYSAPLLTVTGPIGHGAQYDVRPLGSAAVDGQIDSAGGTSDGLPSPPDGRFLLFSLPIHTDAAGTLNIAAQPDDAANNKVEFFFSSIPVTDIQFVGNSIPIQGAGITVAPTSGLVTTEAGGTATFTVQLDAPPTANVTIGLSSSDTTEGTVGPASLTFTSANWNTPQTVTVTGVNDAVADGNVGYSIITAAATSSDANYSGRNAADVAVTNQDNDTAGITVAPTSGLITTEAGGTATFTVRLDSEPTANVTIGLSSSDTTEGTVAPASLSFTPANWNSPQTVTVTGVNDALVDGNIAYNIVTVAATSADPNYSGRDAADVAVTNQDDDAPGITVVPTSGLVTTEAGGAASFTIRLDTEPAANVTIGLSSSDTTEGTVGPASVTFTPANWNTPQTVTVTGVNDAVADGNVAYSVVTTAATSTDPNYSGRNAADVQVTNQDNDTAGITVAPTSGLTTTEAGGTATFTVRLDSEPISNVAIGLSSSDTTEGTVGPASLTFTPANWSTPQTVTVMGVNDALADGNVAYSIITAAATSTDPSYSNRNAADAAVTNQDNDTPGITVAPTSGLVTTETGGTATFTVRLDSEPTANVTIGLSSSDTTEGTVSPTSLTFTPANWNTPQTVTVTGVSDAATDGNVAYTIVTAAATSTDSNYSGRNAADVAVTNQDNVAGIVVAPTSGLTTTEAGGTATFTVALTQQPTANVTIGLSSSDTTEGTVGPASLVFTSANWNAPQTVTVTGVGDAIADGNVAYTIVTAAAVSSDPSYSGMNASDVAVTNQDDDTAGITVAPTSGLTTTEAGGTATFTVRLDSEPTANVTIGLSSSDATEGTAGPASLTFTPANWNVPQTVTVTGANDAIADGNVAYTIVTAAATSSDASYSGRNAADVQVTNQDNDTAGITVTPTSGLVTTEAGGTATFTVQLTSEPTANVVIGLSSSDTTEGTVAPASLTFTPANWNVPQTVTITGADDALIDGNVAYSIVTAAAVSTDPGYQGRDADNVAVTNSDDEQISLSVVRTNDGSEAGPAAGLFTVSQSTTTSSETRVNYSVTGTATPGADYATLSGTAIIPAGQTSVTIPVNVLGDELIEGAETVIVTLTTIEAGDSRLTIDSATSDATAEIDDDESGLVSIVVTTNGNEMGPVSPVFTISQDGTASSDTVVNFAFSGTATAGADFTPPALTVTIPAGQTTATVTVPIVNDTVVEANETLIATLSLGAHDPLVALDPAQSAATATILDNDTAQVSVAAAADGDEAGPVNGRFTITQSATSTVDTTISYTITGSAASGSDFTPLTGSVTIPAGQTSAEVEIAVLDDNLVEATENVTITLDDISGAALVTIDPAQNTASLDIVDNDTAFVSIALQANGSESGPAAASYLVSLSKASSTATTISYQVAGTATSGNDFTSPSGSVTIPAGSLSAAIDVNVLDDQLLEGSETVIITLGAVTSGDPQISLDAGALTASATIADNETGLISVAATTPGSEAGPTSGRFTVTQAGITTTDTVISYQVAGSATAASGDFAALSGTVTIPAGGTSAAIDVAVIDDQLVEGPENVSITLSAITSGNAALAIDPAADEATLDIADNDTAQLSIERTADAAEAGAAAGSFTVRLDRAAAVDTVVTYTVGGTAASGDFTPLPGTATILAGQTTATIVVTPVDDAVVEANETVLVTITGVNPGLPAVVINSESDAATLEITDDDAAQVSVATTTPANESGAVPGVFTVSLTAASSTSTVVAYSISGTATSGSDFTALTGTVTIPAGATSATVEVPTIDDLAVEGTETVIVTLNSITSGDHQITVNSSGQSATLEIADNDSATIAFAAATSTVLEADGSHVVLVRLTLPAGGVLSRPVTVNITNPTGGTASAGDFTLTTNAVTFAAGSQNGATQPVNLTLTSDNVNEPNETVNLALAIGTDPTGRTTAGSPSQHVVTISDDSLTASLSGFVWADTNGNGRLDQGEITLPGVTVQLTGTGIGGQQVSRTAITDDDGAYHFTNLPGGTYTIFEQQPVAMIDGLESLGTVEGVRTGTVGSDQFTNIVLPIAASGVNYNFGEVSLRAQYVNARSFTVSVLTQGTMLRDTVLRTEQAAQSASSAFMSEAEGEPISASPMSMSTSSAAPNAPASFLQELMAEAEGEYVSSSETTPMAVATSLVANLDSAVSYSIGWPEEQIDPVAAIASDQAGRQANPPSDASSESPSSQPAIAMVQADDESPLAGATAEEQLRDEIDQLLQDEDWLRSLAVAARLD